MMEHPLNGSPPFDGIELFNTMMGLLNYASNSSQHENQVGMEKKLDLILAKLSALEGRFTDIGDNSFSNL